MQEGDYNGWSLAKSSAGTSWSSHTCHRHTGTSLLHGLSSHQRIHKGKVSDLCFILKGDIELNSLLGYKIITAFLFFF